MFPHFSVGVSLGISLPYRAAILPSFSNGTQIHISGTPTGDRFEVNLINDRNDIVLHFNPRFDSHILVLNSVQKGSWGQEERHRLPIQRCMRFTMMILATDDSLRFYVNNQYVCEFHQRISLYSADLIEVKGDISLESVQIYLPTAEESCFKVLQIGSIQPCHMHVGSRITLSGSISLDAKQFEINLLQGYSDADDIAFHFNLHFDSRTIVKNHRRNGQWGQEENQSFPSSMPLKPGSSFNLEITCYSDKYTIQMRNILIAEFYHKTAPESVGKVVGLQCKGDITLTSIG